MGYGVDELLGIIMVGWNKLQFVVLYFLVYYGVDQDMLMDEFVYMVMIRECFGYVEIFIEVLLFCLEQEVRVWQVVDFMCVYGFWDECEFVMLEIVGQIFVIVDIGMWMFFLCELFNVQGFLLDYVIDGVWQGEGESCYFIVFLKDVQVSCCGNSVFFYFYVVIVVVNCNDFVVVWEVVE